MAAPQPSLQRPVTCLLPIPKQLLPLPAGFPTLTPWAKRQALLDLHSRDGEAYATALAELQDCQDFIRRLP